MNVGFLSENVNFATRGVLRRLEEFGRGDIPRHYSGLLPFWERQPLARPMELSLARRSSAGARAAAAR
jgi:hypothetical protein